MVKIECKQVSFRKKNIVATFTHIINFNHTITTKVKITILVGFQIITNIGNNFFSSFSKYLMIFECEVVNRNCKAEQS